MLVLLKHACGSDVNYHETMDSVQYYEGLGLICEFTIAQPCVTQKHVWRRSQNLYQILATTPDNFFSTPVSLTQMNSAGCQHYIVWYLLWLYK